MAVLPDRTSLRTLPAEPLLAWIHRQRLRLDASGSSWDQWCHDHKIRTRQLREVIVPGKLISYADADEVLCGARMRPEDIYGYPEETAV